MNIGIFTDSFKPYTSGVVRSIEIFLREFKRLGHEVYIFGPNYPNCTPEDKVFRFFSIPAPTQPGFTLAIPISPNLGLTIKKLNLHIIHVHSPFLMGRLGANAARRAGIPLVFTYHTLYDQYVHYIPFAQKVTKRVVKVIGRDFCNRCDLIITPSNTVRQYLHNLGVKSAIETIPTGIVIDQIEMANKKWLRNNFSIGDHEKLLLFVGRLGKEKNIQFLLDSFQYICKTMDNVKMILVGKGPEEGNLKRFINEKNIHHRVIFTGALEHKEVLNCYAAADLFVFASITETQGLVVGEAKASGLPIVAVGAFGVSEIVRDKEDGFLTTLSLPEFTLKILTLLKNDELRMQMSQKARVNSKYLSSHYSAQKMIRLYKNLLFNITRNYSA